MDSMVGPPPRGVYPPREDSRLLLPFADVPAGSRFLEIGSGAGEAALRAAGAGARVVATDRNRAALAWLRTRAARAGLAVEVVRTDLARGLGRFDRILANPPYLPTPDPAVDPEPADRLALDGGADGVRVTARILDELPQHLAPHGTAFVLVSSVQRPEALEAVRRGWIERGGRQRVAARRVLEGETLAVWELSAAPASG
jgi:release factor glutamine methyltransferase